MGYRLASSSTVKLLRCCHKVYTVIVFTADVKFHFHDEPCIVYLVDFTCSIVSGDINSIC